RELLGGLDFGPLVSALEAGNVVTTGESVTAQEFLDSLPTLVTGLYDDIADRLDATDEAERASAIELALEGLYLARRITQDSDGPEPLYGGVPTTGRGRRETMTQHHRGTRYGRYSGGPHPLAPPVDLTEALDAIGEEVMAGYSPEGAMREFLRRGDRDTPGLDDLARRVAEKRRELLQRHDLDGTLRDVRELLDKAVLAERKQLARDLDDDARFQEMRIADLSPNTAAAVTELSDYSWRSPDAREAYEQIRDLLGREALDQRFAGMKQALENASDA